MFAHILGSQGFIRDRETYLLEQDDASLIKDETITQYSPAQINLNTFRRVLFQRCIVNKEGGQAQSEKWGGLVNSAMIDGCG